MPELHVSSQSPAGKNQDQSVKTDKPPAPPVVDVVIVGAGLAGLSAAYTLRMANQGISVVVLEASGTKKHDSFIYLFRNHGFGFGFGFRLRPLV